MEILKDINLVQALLAVLLAYVVWSWKRALNKFEASVTDLYEKYGAANTRLTRVETIHSIKGCDTSQPPKKERSEC